MWCFLHDKNGIELNSKSASYEFSLLPRKLLQVRWFTITRVCHPTISVTQEPRCGLAGCSPQSPGTAAEVSSGLCSHMEARMGKSLPPGALRVLVEATSLGLNARGPDFLLALGWRPLSHPQGCPQFSGTCLSLCAVHDRAVCCFQAGMGFSSGL